MPVALILDFPDGSIEKYDTVIERMDLGGHLPQGALFHAAGPGPQGGLRVLDVWESDAAFRAFADAEIGPRTAEAGMAPPQVERVQATVRETGLPRRSISFAHVTRLPIDADGFAGMYEEVMAQGAPDGMVFHANGPAPGGGWIVVGAWTSREARDAMLAERVIPAAQRRGMGPPEIEDMEVHNVLEPAEVRA
jgi:hypothetical protein